MKTMMTHLDQTFVFGLALEHCREEHLTIHRH